MRVFPPNKQTVGTYAQSPRRDPMVERKGWGKGSSTRFLLPLRVCSPESQHGGPPAGDMTQVSSWTLLLANVPT